ncbi:hypothetical protein [Anaerosolibacter sp.]|uniref:hypothetical protein n=1 Tax=Anaerosolibacter sp. TaxID=1872527 RepID=UPI0039EE28FA
MKEHILKEKAFTYDLPRTLPTMEGYEFNDEKGYWVNQTNSQPCIEDPLFAAPRTKKADIETGEDRKGE